MPPWLAHRRAQETAQRVEWHRRLLADYLEQSRRNWGRQQGADALYDPLGSQSFCCELFLHCSHGEFYDEAISGADPIEGCKGFAALLDHTEGNGVRVVIVKYTSRFARELMVQELGITLLGAAFERLPAGFLAKDHVAVLGTQSGNLAVETLVRAAHSCIANPALVHLTCCPAREAVIHGLQHPTSGAA